MNPLLDEYKRSHLRTVIVVMCLAFSAAIVDYFVALNQRISQQQNLLNSAVEDLDHQFSPLLHLMTVLKADAEVTLLSDQASDTSQALPGQMWSVSAEQADVKLSDAEVAMLQQLMPKLMHSQRSTLAIRQFNYVSNNGAWYSANDARTAALELQSKLYWEQKLQQHKLGLPDIRLHKVDAAETIFLLAIPLQKKELYVGELLLELADALVQLSLLGASSRSGDVLVSAAEGWDLRSRFEPVPHVSTHGALLRDQMLVPLIVDVPITHTPQRTTDIVPSALDLLAIPADTLFDGRSFLR